MPCYHTPKEVSFFDPFAYLSIRMNTRHIPVKVSFLSSRDNIPVLPIPSQTTPLMKQNWAMADILLVISIPMSSLYDIYLNPNVKKIAILGTLPSIFWYKQIYDVFLCLVIPRYPCRDDIYLDIYIHIYPVLSAAARVYCGIIAGQIFPSFNVGWLLRRQTFCTSYGYHVAREIGTFCTCIT